MKRLSLKAILSSLLLLLFLFLAFSGALLHFGKTGLIWGFARHSLRDAHALAAVLICVLIAAHVFLNRRLYLRELRALGSRKADDAKAGGRDEKSR